VQALVATLWGGLAVVAIGVAGPAARLGSPVDWALLGIAVVAVALTTLVLGWRFRARVGGVTGDFLGATQQAGELVWLVAWAWMLAP
jgi:adenosylcobinamide-GDP ribazoletransferase